MGRQGSDETARVADLSDQGEKNGRRSDHGATLTYEHTASPGDPFRVFRVTASLFTLWAQACPKNAANIHAPRGEERAGEPISSDAASPNPEPLASGTPCKWDVTQPTIRGEL